VLGVGSLPEEVFKVCLRDDCLTVRMLRRRALKNFIKLAASAEFSKLVDVADMTVKRIGYVITEESRIAAVRNAVVKEYVEVLKLDLPLNKDIVDLLGGQPSWMLEELSSGNSVVDALRVAMMAFYMEYLDRSDWQQLDVLDFVAYAVLEMLRRGWVARSRAAELLKWITDQVLSASLPISTATGS
jgi:hypothetical protein